MVPENPSILSSLHPLSILVYLSLLLSLVLIYSHPLYTAVFLIITVCLNLAVDNGRELKKCLRFLVPLLFLTVIVNLLLNRHGSTVIITLRLPTSGGIALSMEAAAYGLVMAVKLGVITAIFTALNSALDLDRVMSLLTRASGKTTIVISLALRAMSLLSQEMRGIVEVSKTRGVDFDAGPRQERIKKRYLLVKALLLTSLESVWETAESLQARAFGAGRRTCYRPETFRPGDLIVIGSSLFCLVSALVSLVEKSSPFVFYPELGRLIDGAADLVIPVVLMAGLAVPIFLETGYRSCPYIRSKV